MTQLRRLFVVPLALSSLGAGGAVAVPALHGHNDRPQWERASAVARGLRAPVGAVASRQCHGDAQVACWEIRTSVVSVADELSKSLDGLKGSPVVNTCDQVRIGTAGKALTSAPCFVRVRFGRHGTFAFVDPLVERDPHGTATVVGALVSLSAA